MITLVDKGDYVLLETKNNTKILSLDEKNYFAWISVKSIGELLITSKKPLKTDVTLAMGKFRLYSVKNEEHLTDLLHLELSVGDGVWQGYLLPVGLPNGVRRRRIIPTQEIITKPLN